MKVALQQIGASPGEMLKRYLDQSDNEESVVVFGKNMKRENQSSLITTSCQKATEGSECSEIPRVQ